MLSERRAHRLASRAGTKGWDFGPSRAARRAWRRLARAAGRGDPRAVQAAWRAWLDLPAAARLDALARWHLPEAMAGLVFGAATDPLREAAERHAIGAVCTRLGAAPADAAERAVFYVLTGQPEQHAAADPDGTLLAAGYRRLWRTGSREAVREAIAGSGRLDLVRVIADGRGEVPGKRLEPKEAEYLLAELPRRRDWPGLWRAVKHLPLAGAVAAMPRFGDGWRPGDEPDLALFSLLDRAGAARIEAARGALTTPPAARLGLDPDSYHPECSFSGDGRYLAVATNFYDTETWWLFALPDGALVRRHQYQPGLPWVRKVAVTAAGGMFGYVPDRPGVLAVRPSQPELLLTHEALYPHQVEPYQSGFLFLHGPADGRKSADTGLVFCDAAGRALHEVMLGRDLGMPPSAGSSRTWVLAVQQDTGRLLAEAGDGRLWLLDRGARRVLAVSAGDADVGQAYFLDPGRLVTASYRRGLGLWQLSAGRLEPATQVPADQCWLKAVSAARGEIAVDGDHRTAGWYAADTLAMTASASELRIPRRTWPAPNGRSCVRERFRDQDYSHVDLDYVADAWPAAAVLLAGWPLASLGLADLATVRSALGYRGPVAGRPFLDLLEQWLRTRFGTEVALRTGTSAGPAEIALSPEVIVDCSE